MSRNKLLIILISAFLLFIILNFILVKNQVFNKNAMPSKTQTVTQQDSDTISYTNNLYGFTFTLPARWKGYIAITSKWEGNRLDIKTDESIRGPQLNIRHPLWTSSNPRQDIPIMIFTLDQWNLIQQEKLSVGAAPVAPTELGRNKNYVFALPARYNYAFPAGFEEVQTIIDSKPLKAF